MYPARCPCTLFLWCRLVLNFSNLNEGKQRRSVGFLRVVLQVFILPTAIVVKGRGEGGESHEAPLWPVNSGRENFEHEQ
jgi:hypothetical protein